ncbi:MAG: UPF0182 family protein [Patescibacteria group bacterium]
MRKGKRFATLVIILLFLLGVLPATISFSTDWIWFSSEGYSSLFTTIVLTKLLLGITVSVLFFGLLLVNVYIAKKIAAKYSNAVNSSLFRFRGIEIGKLTFRILIPIALVIALLTGIAASTSWQSVLQFFNRVPFGTEDSLFGRDISFYFFVLPFVKLIYSYLMSALILSLIGAGILYLSRGMFSLKRVSLKIERHVSAHFSFLLFFVFSLLASKTYFVGMTDLLYSTTGPFTGASYTDVVARLPLLWILCGIAAITAVLFFINIFTSIRKVLITSIAIYFAVAIIGIPIYPMIIQKLIVLPNELVKETEYIEKNIAATRKAYKIDTVIKRELTSDSIQLTSDDIKNNELTIKNIRLWDRGPLLDTFGQLQEIRTYYDFVSVDNDRYVIDDEYRQTMLSPRELNTASLPSATFINERLTFTHGFGVALGPVNEVTAEGLPLLFVKDLPPVSNVDTIQVTRPEIYFGELSSDYVFVNTKADEFNYPSGEENVYSEYIGDSGIAIDSILKKALFAARFSSLKIFLSNDISSESKVLMRRNITERMKTVVPFLNLDSDPYLVITEGGKLKWIYDAYTTGDAYPYAEYVTNIAPEIATAYNTATPSYGTINYIRNSVKAVIDAYDGSMDFYISDPGDPIIQVYAKIFPGVFQPIQEMPEDLKKHIRYPEDIFRYQTMLYETYHMEQPQVFYNKEDKWEVPQVSDEQTDPMMRHMIMKLPQEETEEFILMLPYTPRSKDNLSAWIVARADGDHYGELVVYRFPKQTLVFGPKQIVNRISQDADISKQISLWDQHGSEVIQGNLLVIPIEESLLYVRPLYLRAEGGKIPELKRVIVAYESRIAMDETLEKALNQIFGSGSSAAIAIMPEQPAEDSSTSEELVSKALEHYQNAIEAQRMGDWGTYGSEINELGNILEQLKK